MIKCILSYCNYRGTPGTSHYCERSLRKLLGNDAVVTLGHCNDIDVRDTNNPYPVLQDKILSGELDLARDAFLLEVESGGFDLGWVPPKDLGVPTAWWGIDTHISLNHHFVKASNYDKVFIAQKAYLSHIQSANQSTEWLLLACDPDIHDGQNITKVELDGNPQIVFVGHIHPAVHKYRLHLIHRLQTSGIRVNVYVEKWLKDVTQLYASSPMVLNCSLNGDINMRFFEALASGSLLVQDMFPPESGIEEVLSTCEDEIAMFYSSHDAVPGLILANINDSNKTVIPAYGREWVLKHHTYDHRMRVVLDRMGVSYDG